MIDGKKLFSDKTMKFGIAGLLLLTIPALFAPFIANGRPLWMKSADGISFPFLRTFFAPDSPEVAVESCFNFAGIFILFYLLIMLLTKRKVLRLVFGGIFALALGAVFFLTPARVDKFDYRTFVSADQEVKALFAPIPYGPFEIVGSSYEKPGKKHIFGTDEIGRDVAARIIYGARVSLAVGIFSALIALLIGAPVGLCCGFFGGKFDLFTMRLIEILICFPTFLLLLILMSMLGEYHFEQSAPLLIAVIGLTGWIGMAMLVRGEVLKCKKLPYIESCIVSGVPKSRILFYELLPNVSGVLLIWFSFAVAGAILAESSLSFLGFGVRSPVASWGGLLRQAFDNPLDYWHLTLFPGLALFVAVISFNFIGEGLRKSLDVRNR